jgi:hypothetical protein
MVKKTFQTWLVLDAKTGKYKVLSSKLSLKSLKSKLKPAEIPINLTMNIDVPETPILKAQGEIKLSQAQISELLLTEIEDDENKI